MSTPAPRPGRLVTGTLFTLAFILLAAGPPPIRSTAPIPANAGTWEASGTHGAVVAGGAGAVEAGLEILKDGGNAVDGAVATILALSVTDATAFCFGGEVPILVYDAKTKGVEVIAGMGAAPGLATPEYFAGRETIPGSGIEAAAVPAALDACLVALDRHGTISFTRAAKPMLRLLDAGKLPWHADLARTVRALCDAESAAGGDRRRGLRLVGEYFYRGPVARRIDAWSRASGGLIRYEDLARHVTRVEEPATAVYRGMTVAKCGPWTQGPALLEALQILEGFDLGAAGHASADAVHAEVEALKLAFADRDTFYADPLLVDVPMKGLLDPSYAEKRRKLIEKRSASLELRPGDPVAGKALLDRPGTPFGSGGPAQDTTTCVVADGNGNVVAATPSGWSGVVAGDTGVWLGSRLQSFNLWPGHPNRIAPGKRPRITLTPTIVLDRERRPLLALSVAGGDNQDQMMLQLVANHVDFGLSPSDSVLAPRWMSEHFVGSFRQAPPKLGSLRINPSYGPPVLSDLTSRGHKLSPAENSLGAAATVISVDPSTRLLRAAGDPRAGRHAGAF